MQNINQPAIGSRAAIQEAATLLLKLERNAGISALRTQLKSTSFTKRAKANGDSEGDCESCASNC